jgi:hypothetical protein
MEGDLREPFVIAGGAKQSNIALVDCFGLHRSQ